MPHPHNFVPEKGTILCLCSSIVKDRRHEKSFMDLTKKIRRSGSTRPFETGGRTWTRTRDFILIRDAL